MHHISVLVLCPVPFLFICTHTHTHTPKSRGEGVKSFSCNKEGPAYPRVLFLETLTRCAHVHTWWSNNHYFWCPVMIPPLHNRVVCCWGLKMEGSVSTRVTQPLRLLLRSTREPQPWSFRAILFLCVHKCFRPSQPNHWLAVCKIKMQRVSHDVAPGEGGVAIQQLHPWATTCLTPPEQPLGWGGGTLVQFWTTYLHKLSFVLVQLQCITNLVPPLPPR